MHGLVPTKKQFTKVGRNDRTGHVKMIGLSGKNALERLQQGTDGLLCWSLPEPVYEIGTMWIRTFLHLSFSSSSLLKVGKLSWP